MSSCSVTPLPPGNWDTSLQWGVTPVLAVSARVGDTALSLGGLGSGTLPQGATFSITGQPFGQPFTLYAPAPIESNTAVLLLTAPVTAGADAGTAITDFNSLCTDSDLADQDSAMPELGKKITNSTSGRSAYDGKRKLVKRDIGAHLLRLGYQTGGVLTPSQFCRAAVFLELAYIYSDLAKRNDEIAAAKAKTYLAQYDDEIESVKFDYDPPFVADTTIRTVIPIWRA